MDYSIINKYLTFFEDLRNNFDTNCERGFPSCESEIQYDNDIMMQWAFSWLEAYVMGKRFSFDTVKVNEILTSLTTIFNRRHSGPTYYLTLSEQEHHQV
jgi:hypothetical protein